MDFQPSTLQQRESFYTEEFDEERVRSWFAANNVDFPQLLGIDMGSETKMTKDKNRMDKIVNLKAVDLKNKFIGHLPEDVYYDRNRYKKPDDILESLDFKNVWTSNNLLGQQLAFDLDPENVTCICKGFCDICMKKTVEHAVELAEKLKDKFKQVSLVYSGQGMHVHVFDKEAFTLSINARDHLNEKYREFPLDPWVSKGYMRLMRLPYTLHGEVSRIVTPLTIREAKKFDPADKKVMPKFLE